MQSLESLERAAQNGDNTARSELARRLLLGRGLAKDMDRAAMLLRLAADDHDLNGEVGLAYCHTLGVKNTDTGIRPMVIWKHAAEKNNAWAQMILGVYESNEGSEQKLRSAAEWYEKAAANESGLISIRIDALEFLGRLYSGAKGLPADRTKSMAYYQRAANLGSSTAKTILAASMWVGEGLPKDSKRALELALEAAHDGNRLAAEMVGRFYEWGNEIPANFIEARRFYALAQKNGSLIAPFLSGALLKTNGDDNIDTDKLHALTAALDLTRLTASDCFDIAYSLDLAKDFEQAQKFYRQAMTSTTAVANLSTRSDLKKIVYFRDKEKKGYFDVLASSTILQRNLPGQLKVFIPTEQAEGGGYSKIERDLIIESIEHWLRALPGTLQLVKTENKDGSDLKFIPIDKNMFFGTATARTCYLSEPNAQILPAANECVVQLPKFDIRSQDDQTNFFSTCLHEVGHALGLRGHSIFGGDAMFGSRKHQTNLSERDIAAIRSLYEDNADQKILAVLRSECDKNNPYALARFGLHLMANGREQEAVQLLQKASKDGIGLASQALGVHYMRKLNLIKAREYFAHAVDHDVVNAGMYKDILSGKFSVTDDKTIDAIRKSAEYGSTQSLVAMGMLYTFGNGESIKRDHHKAKEYLQMAADQGSNFARVLLTVNDAGSFVGNLFSRK
jgi:TPR repeat protein